MTRESLNSINFAEKLDEATELLRKVATDDDHFNYMKNLASSQPVTLPITVLHGITEEMVPVLEDTFKCKLNYCC